MAIGELHQIFLILILSGQSSHTSLRESHQISLNFLNIFEMALFPVLNIFYLFDVAWFVYRAGPTPERAPWQVKIQGPSSTTKNPFFF